MRRFAEISGHIHPKKHNQESFSCTQNTLTLRSWPDSHLVFDLPADLLQRLLLGFGQRQFGGDGVTLGHQRAALFLSQYERAGTLQFLHTNIC